MVLVDTNVLLRIHTPSSIHHAECVALLNAIRDRAHGFVVCPQTIIEFWVVASRPEDRNGLGMTFDAVANAVEAIMTVFPSLPEPTDILKQWLELVRAHKVAGKPAHDTRLAAFMLCHGIPDLVTFNGGDFKRFTEIRCRTPAEALQGGLADS